MKKCFADRGRARVSRHSGGGLLYRLAGCVPACLLALACLSGTMGAGAAQAQSEDPIRSRQRELLQLKEEIEENRTHIDELKRKEEDLANLATRLETDRELTQRYLQELSTQERALRQDMADRQSDLLDMEVEATQTAQRLKRRLLRYYKLRHVSGGELLFSSQTFNELFARSQFLARLIHSDRLDLAALGQERAEIARATAALDSRRRAIELLQQEKRNEEDRLVARGRQAQFELEGVQDERAAYERRLQEQESSRAAIRGMIARLEKERERSVREGSTTATFGDFEGARGNLLWPVEGSVLAEFGVEIHPKYNTRVPVNGIVIAAAAGTPVRSTSAGVVEFVDWYPGYGRTVVLNHGGGYYTLYAHASAILVRQGQEVAAGQEIARVGDTDSLRGPCLHFEVRKGTEALDPRNWLR